ncbi:MULTISPECIES: hypothetical protein [unclassified Paenibacillus]
MDRWFRRKLQMCLWKHWKNPRIKAVDYDASVCVLRLVSIRLYI